MELSALLCGIPYREWRGPLLGVGYLRRRHPGNAGFPGSVVHSYVNAGTAQEYSRW
jgi:hypothetical protein